jgi:hypothetical protein
MRALNHGQVTGRGVAGTNQRRAAHGKLPEALPDVISKLMQTTVQETP